MQSTRSVFLGKRLTPNKKESVSKKIKFEFDILQIIERYKKQMGKFAHEYPNASPTTILINLLLFKKKEDKKISLNFFCTPPDYRKKHIDFENTLLTQLGYVGQNTDEKEKIKFYFSKQEYPGKLLFLLNQYLEHTSITPKECLFGLLIAFLDYYNDYFRLLIDFHREIESFPNYHKHFFTPLTAAYQFKQNQDHEAKYSALSYEVITDQINKNYMGQEFQFLKFLKISDPTKFELLEKLLELALCKDTKRNNPNIRKQREEACLAIKGLGPLKEVNLYLQKFVVPLYKFSRDQMVRRTACELLGACFTLVESEKADEIFAQIKLSLQRWSTGKQEVFGACNALKIMPLSPDQLNTVFPLLTELLQKRYENFIIQTFFSLDLTDEQLKILLKEKKMRFWFLGAQFTNFINRKQRSIEFYEYLIDWFLSKYRHYYSFYQIFSSILIPVSKQEKVYDFLTSYISIDDPYFSYRPYSFKALAATQQDTPFIFKIAIRLLKKPDLDPPFFTSRKDIIDFFSLLHFSPDNLNEFRQDLASKYNHALEDRMLADLLLSIEINEKLQLNIPEINEENLMEKFSEAKLAFLILKKFNIPLNLQYVIFFHECFSLSGYVQGNLIKKWQQISGNKENNALFQFLQEETKVTPETKSTLLEMVQYLVKIILEGVDVEFNRLGRCAMLKMACDLLSQIKEPFMLFELDNTIFKYEMKAKKLFAPQRLISLTEDFLVVIKKLLTDFITENEGYIHLNFLAYLENQDKNGAFPSFYHHHLIQFIREESAKLVAINLMAKKYALPGDVTNQIKYYVYKT